MSSCPIPALSAVTSSPRAPEWSVGHHRHGAVGADPGEHPAGVAGHGLLPTAGPATTPVTGPARVMAERVQTTNVLGYSDVASYLSPTNPYLGATVGRYANRIARGRFTLGGKRYLLRTNEADTYLPVDHRAIPLGRLDPVAGTPFDLTTPAAIGHRARHNHPQIKRMVGIDHAFHLRGEGMRRAARLEHPESGRFLEISTDQPSLQVYTGNRLDGTITSRDGRLLLAGDGIALETQRHPDAPNQPTFPSAVLNPGESYCSATTWRLGVS
ncbi:hypothetical protein [Micromonospora sp. NPDC050200]|uniref:aldose epimerase family protein n=1 Tax=Micromonospora sp. NPDC050200 TaxID=3155664 RepID=UPI0033C37768